MLYVLLVLSLILCCLAATHNSGFAQAVPTAVTTPTPPPLPASPVDTFRRILAMSQPDREKFLATLTADKREVVTRKLEEYQGLTAEEREARLRALQVRVYVRLLIRVAPSNRVERLVPLAPAEREQVQIRLAQWDQLPPEKQKEVLANEMAIRHIASSPDFMFNPALPPFPQDKRVEGKVKEWRDLSESKREEILAHFQYFFEQVSDKERVKIMAERPGMAKLDSIHRLTKEQRERYIAGFKRFNSLTPAERQKFLINAAHWQTMTPQQREAWRVMAKKLSTSTPPPPPPRPSASVLPATDRAAADIPSR